jgi:putative ABC transport system permease protein
VETNGLALRTYNMGLKYHGKMYYYLLGNGATRHEALRYFEKRALEKVSAPCISRMALMVMGFSPIVMWSMLMAGSGVLTALAFQVLILISTFCASVMSMIVSIRVASKLSVDKYGKLKEQSEE